MEAFNQPGIAEYLALDKVARCGVCLDSYASPVTLRNCGHSFCKSCIECALQVKSQCPLCGDNCNMGFISLEDSAVMPILRNVFKLLESIGSRIDVGAPRNQPSPKHVISAHSHPPFEQPSSPPPPPSPTPVTFNCGDIVNVAARLWAGINKPGGAAWVTKVNDDGSYNVKYIVSCGHDKNVPHEFVEAQQDLDRSARRKSLTPVKRERGLRSGLPILGGLSDESGSSKRNKRRQSSGSGSGSGGADNDPREIVILPSGVDGVAMAQIEKFATKFACKISNNFDSTVTHVIVPVTSQKCFKQRTMKYMQGLMSGVWIVGPKWVRDSLALKSAGTSEAPVDEKAYEVATSIKATLVHAPRRAREHIEQLRARGHYATGHKRGGLFYGIVVLLFGAFPSPGPPRSHLQDLLSTGGADVVVNVAELVRLCGAPAADGSAGRKVIVVCTNLEALRCLVEELQLLRDAQSHTVGPAQGGSGHGKGGESTLQPTITKASTSSSLNADDMSVDELFKTLRLGIPMEQGLGARRVVNPMWILDCVTNYSTQVQSPLESEFYAVRDNIWL